MDAIKFNHNLEVNKMTSREFYQDPRARLDYQQYILRDTEYFKQYQLAILYNKHLFVGRTVLNLNCGLGLLALFAAKAGAKTVYAIDNSKVVEYTRQIVACNGFEDIIQVIEGAIQEINLPTKVDVIIADWLGYTLLFESTCADVIYARDTWLKQPGIILPDIANLYLVLGQNFLKRNDIIDWWYNVHGFNMQALRQSVTNTPRFQNIGKDNVLTNGYNIYSLNMNTATIADLKVRSQFMFDIKRSGKIDVVITYFEAKFSKSHVPVHISTKPSNQKTTRFKQGVFYFNEPVCIESSSLIYGGIEMYPAQFNTDLNNININFELYTGNPEYSNLVTEMHWKLSSFTDDKKKKKVANNEIIEQKIDTVEQVVNDEKFNNNDINGNEIEKDLNKNNDETKGCKQFNKTKKNKKKQKKINKKL